MLRELGLFALVKQSLRKGAGGLSINTSVGKYHRQTGKRYLSLRTMLAHEQVEINRS